MSASPEGQVEQLALAVAVGSTVRAWCKKNDVAERTAYAWSGTPDFKARVVELRAAMIDKAIGRLSRAACRAVDALARIIKPGSTATRAEQISASKAILSSLIEVRSHAEFDARFAAVERKLAGVAQNERQLGQVAPLGE
jgi:hypothetical protein